MPGLLRRDTARVSPPSRCLLVCAATQKAIIELSAVPHRSQVPALTLFRPLPSRRELRHLLTGSALPGVHLPEALPQS